MEKIYLIVVLILSLFSQISGYQLQSDGCFKGKSDVGVSINDQIQIATQFWKYEWDPIHQGVGVIQIVNSGSDSMWIRYGGAGINPGDEFDWQKYIISPSLLNGNVAHKWNGLNTNGMQGQGNGFKLNSGEYQILPYTGVASWFGGSVGCCKNGNNCVINPLGRGGQQNTLFEWTSAQYGVWDISFVDGFQLPAKVEVIGSQSGDSVTYFEMDPKKCTNPVYQNNTYICCKSMCACQGGGPPYKDEVDPDCSDMTTISKMPSFPESPVNDQGRLWGYCGCPSNGCSAWLNQLFAQDQAGQNYCNSVKQMASNSKNQRAAYCQAYDDDAGQQTSGDGIIKVSLCNYGFESIKDQSDIC